MKNLDLRLTERLPVLGILAFALCSVNSLANLFLGHAKHPTPALWFASALVELVSAWLVYETVGAFRRVTRSNLSKQDRRFHRGILTIFSLALVPSLGLSIAANAVEFGSVALGFVFPILAVVCAVGTALPEAVAKHETRKANERQEKANERKRKANERQRAASAAQAEANERQELAKQLSNLGNAIATLRQFLANPTQSQASAAQALGISRQAVGNHLSRLERAGIIERNGQGVKLLVDLPPGWDNGAGRKR